ncbi:YicC-like family, N-terminal region [Actinobacillus equuli]|nr:YicC-like family, N-terminal region [Actinobacillus equuli]
MGNPLGESTFLETYFRLPEQFRNLEMTLRERLRASLTRGKVECSLRIELSNNQNSELALNKEYAEKVISSLQTLRGIAGEGEINLVDILRYPGVVDAQTQDLDQIGQDLLAGLNKF